MKNENLVINPDVIAKMAGIAAKEVEGVAGLASTPIDIKNTFNKSTQHSKHAVVTTDLTGVKIDIYISLKDGYKLQKVAEAVQANVQSAVQDMTGTEVKKINVYVADIDFGTEEEK